MNGWAPITSTRSNPASAPAIPAATGSSVPRHSGWSVGNTRLAWTVAPYTGAWSSSATSTMAGIAPEAAASSATTNATRPGALALRRSASSPTGPATAPRSMRDGRGIGASPASSSTSIGIDTNTGPVGGEAASWKARRTTTPSSPRWRTSCAHFTVPRARPTRSPPSNGSATQHVADVGLPGEGVHQRQLGGARVPEHVAHALAGEDLEQRVAAGSLGHRLMPRS